MNLSSIFKNKKYRKKYFGLVLVFSFLYFIFKNFLEAVGIFRVSVFSFWEKMDIFLSSLFNISELQSFPMLFLILFFIFSISLFFLLVFILYKESKKIDSKKSALSSISIFLSILGLSCTSCGIGLLASLLSFLGLSSIVSYFPWGGLELGFLGVIFLNISNYFLLKRIKSPFTC